MSIAALFAHNRRENVMTIRIKLIAAAAMLGAVFAALEGPAFAEPALKTVTVYAGPQSISPEKTIFVSVEMTGEAGQNLSGETVELSFISDGRSRAVTGETVNGIAAFEVPAQRRAGLMNFSASASEAQQATAHVLVTSSAPQVFTLSAKPSDKPGYVSLRSSVISDRYGNAISDMALISLNWIDSAGLRGKHTTQPVMGRINLSAPCPKTFTGALKLQASLQTLSVSTPDISTLCMAKES